MHCGSQAVVRSRKRAARLGAEKSVPQKYLQHGARWTNHQSYRASGIGLVQNDLQSGTGGMSSNVRHLYHIGPHPILSMCTPDTQQPRAFCDLPGWGR